MSEGVDVRTDWDALAGKAAKYVAVFAGVMVGVLSLPMFAEQSPLRLLVAGGLAVAAGIGWISGGSLKRKGDPTEGAARRICALLFAAAAVWFSNLVPAPQAIQAPAVAGQVNQAYRTVGGVSSPSGLDRVLSFTFYESEGAASRLEAPLRAALESEAGSRPLRDGSRATGAGIRLTVRQGSLAGGQVTATARVALAADEAPQCDFTVSTPRPMPVQAAADHLAVGIVDRSQTYVEGSDAC